MKYGVVADNDEIRNHIRKLVVDGSTGDFLSVGDKDGDRFVQFRPDPTEPGIEMAVPVLPNPTRLVSKHVAYMNKHAPKYKNEETYNDITIDFTYYKMGDDVEKIFDITFHILSNIYCIPNGKLYLKVYF